MENYHPFIQGNLDTAKLPGYALITQIINLLRTVLPWYTLFTWIGFIRGKSSVQFSHSVVSNSL